MRAQGNVSNHVAIQTGVCAARRSWRRERKALGMEGKETTRVPGKQDLHRRQRMPDETGLKRRTFSIIRRR